MPINRVLAAIDSGGLTNDRSSSSSRSRVQYPGLGNPLSSNSVPTGADVAEKQQDNLGTAAALQGYPEYLTERENKNINVIEQQSGLGSFTNSGLQTLGRVLGILDTPRRLSRLASSQFVGGEGDNVNADLGDYWDVLTQDSRALIDKYGIDQVGEHGDLGGSLLLNQLGWKEAEDFGGKFARFVASAGIDILSDPLMFTEFGLGGRGVSAAVTAADSAYLTSLQKVVTALRTADAHAVKATGAAAVQLADRSSMDDLILNRILRRMDPKDVGLNPETWVSKIDEIVGIEDVIRGVDEAGEITEGTLKIQDGRFLITDTANELGERTVAAEIRNELANIVGRKEFYSDSAVWSAYLDLVDKGAAPAWTAGGIRIGLPFADIARPVPILTTSTRGAFRHGRNVVNKLPGIDKLQRSSLNRRLRDMRLASGREAVQLKVAAKKIGFADDSMTFSQFMHMRETQEFTRVIADTAKQSALYKSAYSNIMKAARRRGSELEGDTEEFVERVAGNVMETIQSNARPTQTLSADELGDVLSEVMATQTKIMKGVIDKQKDLVIALDPRMKSVFENEGFYPVVVRSTLDSNMPEIWEAVSRLAVQLTPDDYVDAGGNLLDNVRVLDKLKSYLNAEGYRLGIIGKDEVVSEGDVKAALQILSQFRPRTASADLVGNAQSLRLRRVGRTVAFVPREVDGKTVVVIGTLDETVLQVGGRVDKVTRIILEADGNVSKKLLTDVSENGVLDTGAEGMASYLTSLHGALIERTMIASLRATGRLRRGGKALDRDRALTHLAADGTDTFQSALELINHIEVWMKKRTQRLASDEQTVVTVGTESFNVPKYIYDDPEFGEMLVEAQKAMRDFDEAKAIDADAITDAARKAAADGGNPEAAVIAVAAGHLERFNSVRDSLFTGAKEAVHRRYMPVREEILVNPTFSREAQQEVERLLHRDLAALEAEYNQLSQDLLEKAAGAIPPQTIDLINDIRNVGEYVEMTTAVYVNRMRQQYEARMVSLRKRYKESTDPMARSKIQLEGELDKIVLDELARLADGTAGKPDVGLVIFHSGLQDGTDAGVLRGAKRVENEAADGVSRTSGVSTKGFRSASGPQEELAEEFGVREGKTASYIDRSKLNVDETDATIAFIPGFSRGKWAASDHGEYNSVGTSKTVIYAIAGFWPNKEGYRKVKADVWGSFVELGYGVHVSTSHKRKPVIVLSYQPHRSEEIAAQVQVVTEWISVQQRAKPNEFHFNGAGPREVKPAQTRGLEGVPQVKTGSIDGLGEVKFITDPLPEVVSKPRGGTDLRFQAGRREELSDVEREAAKAQRLAANAAAREAGEDAPVPLMQLQWQNRPPTAFVDKQGRLWLYNPTGMSLTTALDRAQITTNNVYDAIKKGPSDPFRQMNPGPRAEDILKINSEHARIAQRLTGKGTDGKLKYTLKGLRDLASSFTIPGDNGKPVKLINLDAIRVEAKLLTAVGKQPAVKERELLINAIMKVGIGDREFMQRVGFGDTGGVWQRRGTEFVHGDLSARNAGRMSPRVPRDEDIGEGVAKAVRARSGATGVQELSVSFPKRYPRFIEFAIDYEDQLIQLNVKLPFNQRVVPSEINITDPDIDKIMDDLYANLKQVGAPDEIMPPKPRERMERPVEGARVDADGNPVPITISEVDGNYVKGVEWHDWEVKVRQLAKDAGVPRANTREIGAVVDGLRIKGINVHDDIPKPSTWQTWEDAIDDVDDGLLDVASDGTIDMVSTTKDLYDNASAGFRGAETWDEAKAYVDDNYPDYSTLFHVMAADVDQDEYVWAHAMTAFHDSVVEYEEYSPQIANSLYDAWDYQNISTVDGFEYTHRPLNKRLADYPDEEELSAQLREQAEGAFDDAVETADVGFGAGTTATERGTFDQSGATDSIQQYDRMLTRNVVYDDVWFPPGQHVLLPKRAAGHKVNITEDVSRVRYERTPVDENTLIDSMGKQNVIGLTDTLYEDLEARGQRTFVGLDDTQLDPETGTPMRVMMFEGKTSPKALSDIYDEGPTSPYRPKTRFDTETTGGDLDALESAARERATTVTPEKPHGQHPYVMRNDRRVQMAPEQWSESFVYELLTHQSSFAQRAQRAISRNMLDQTEDVTLGFQRAMSPHGEKIAHQAGVDMGRANKAWQRWIATGDIEALKDPDFISAWAIGEHLNDPNAEATVTRILAELDVEEAKVVNIGNEAVAESQEQATNVVAATRADAMAIIKGETSGRQVAPAPDIPTATKPQLASITDPTGKRPDLNTLKIATLRSLATEENIVGRSKMNKAALVEALDAQYKVVATTPTTPTALTPAPPIASSISTSATPSGKGTIRVGGTSFRQLRGRMQDNFDIADVIVITTNGYVKRNGDGVMGAGIAGDMKKLIAARGGNIEAHLGKHLRENGNVVGIIGYIDGKPIVAMPVKPARAPADQVISRQAKNVKGDTVMGWQAKASPSIIAQSTQELKALADSEGWQNILMPRPGAGAGELDFDRTGRWLNDQLDNRFIVSDFKTFWDRADAPTQTSLMPVDEVADPNVIASTPAEAMAWMKKNEEITDTPIAPAGTVDELAPVTNIADAPSVVEAPGVQPVVSNRVGELERDLVAMDIQVDLAAEVGGLDEEFLSKYIQAQEEWQSITGMPWEHQGAVDDTFERTLRGAGVADDPVDTPPLRGTEKIQAKRQQQLGRRQSLQNMHDAGEVSDEAFTEVDGYLKRQLDQGIAPTYQQMSKEGSKVWFELHDEPAAAAVPASPAPVLAADETAVAATRAEAMDFVKGVQGAPPPTAAPALEPAPAVASQLETFKEMLVNIKSEQKIIKGQINGSLKGTGPKLSTADLEPLIKRADDLSKMTRYINQTIDPNKHAYTWEGVDVDALKLSLNTEFRRLRNVDTPLDQVKQMDRPPTTALRSKTKPKDAVYVGRGSPFGNPFVVPGVKSKDMGQLHPVMIDSLGTQIKIANVDSLEEAVGMYQEALWRTIEADPAYAAKVKALAGQKLWYPGRDLQPGELSHARVLAEAAERLQEGQPPPTVNVALQMATASEVDVSDARRSINARSFDLLNRLQQIDDEINMWMTKVSGDMQMATSVTEATTALSVLMHGLDRTDTNVAGYTGPRVGAQEFSIREVHEAQITMMTWVKGVYGEDFDFDMVDPIGPGPTTRVQQPVIRQAGSEAQAYESLGTLPELWRRTRLDPTDVDHLSERDLRTAGVDLRFKQYAKLRDDLDAAAKIREPSPSPSTVEVKLSIEGAQTLAYYEAIMDAVSKAFTTQDAKTVRGLTQEAVSANEVVNTRPYAKLLEVLDDMDGGHGTLLREWVALAQEGEEVWKGDPISFNRRIQERGIITKDLEQTSQWWRDRLIAKSGAIRQDLSGGETIDQVMTQIDNAWLTMSGLMEGVQPGQKTGIGNIYRPATEGSLEARARFTPGDAAPALNWNMRPDLVDEQLQRIVSTLEILNSQSTVFQMGKKGEESISSQLQVVIQEFRNARRMTEELPPGGSFKPTADFGLENGVLAEMYIDELAAVELAAMQDQLRSLHTNMAMFMVMQTTNKLMNWWKAAATVSKPAFHVRNFVGGIWNNYLIGVGLHHYGRIMADVWRFRRALHEYNLETFADPKEAFEKLVIAKLSKRNQAMFREAWDLGVMNKGFARAESIAREGRKGRVSPFSADFYGFKAGGAAMETVEDLHRMATFAKFFDDDNPWTTGRVGREMVNTVHFDYENLTSFERKVKRFVPFFVWTRRNVPLQMRMMMERPSNFLTYERTRRAWQDNMVDKDDPMYDYKRRLGWVNPWGMTRTGIAGDWVQSMMNPDLPFMDVMEFAGIFGADDPVGAGMQYASQVAGPAFNIPLRVLNGVDDAGMTVAPSGINEIGWIIDHIPVVGSQIEPTSGNDYRWSKTLNSLYMSLIPQANEYRALLGFRPNNPYRASSEGYLSEDLDDPVWSPYGMARGIGSVVARGFGLDYYSSEEAFWLAYEAEKYLQETQINMRYRVPDKYAPQP